MSEPKVNLTDPMSAPEMGVKRVGERSFVARNGRGATVRIGKGEGEWTPIELLEMALLGCNALVSDSRLAAVLGDDFQMTGTVTGSYLPDEDRFEAFAVDLRPEINAELDAVERDKLIARTRRAINKLCTVGHTLESGSTFTLTIDGESK